MFGVGEIVGLLALIIATLGFLSRSYAESISEIAGSHLEALQTAGASYGQVLVHGLIPEFLPSWINWTLFSFEINIRASAILGIDVYKRQEYRTASAKLTPPPVICSPLSMIYWICPK